MELGNMAFGNSRGETQIPRTASFEKPWEAFCSAVKLNWYGFKDDGCLIPERDGVLQNDVFAVRSYDWGAECDCGADQKMEAWHEAHHHADHCYQNAVDREMDAYDEKTGFKAIEQRAFSDDPLAPLKGFDQTVEEAAPGITTVLLEPRSDADMKAWRNASDLRNAFEDDLRRKLCAEHGLEYPRGCAVHCDCGHHKNAENAWIEIGGHAESCRLVQPNFLYKPTGLRINWYKYPFRDSYMTPKITPAEWKKIMKHCTDSVLAA